ncbi:TPA: hypothetical protein I9738_001043 [Serratia marcescens]|uniref:hypothetical protein n=1 Tax=Serratia sp. CY29653 TaxID=3383594 RepID=UPI001A26F49C|nr:hypothetical protein [Serratia marcescens]HAT4973123.1 hypothetical protein [Serratia marcescens]HAT4987317.1 hypothetical protein [Serratia marcescens]HAT5047127.1 hypothetical protein [Serratia marcescens]HEJ7078221.1 hypothetical protein [Serratia marcescens]
MKLYEMEGFLRGKCLPGDLLVGESNAEYLVRKLNEAANLKAERDALADRVNALAEENKGLKMKAAFVEARGVDKFADSQMAYVRKHRAELDPMTRAAYCGSATDARRFAAELREAK